MNMYLLYHQKMVLRRLNLLRHEANFYVTLPLTVVPERLLLIMFFRWKVLSLPRNDALLLQPLMRLPEDTVLVSW